MTFYDTSTEMGKTQQEVFTKIFNFSTEYQSLMMMLYIPLYAIMARIVFFNNKKFNLTELIVFFLYTQAQLSICIALLTVTLIPLNIVSLTTLGFLTFPLMLFYFSYCLKRIYGLSTMEIILRTLIFFIVFGFIMVVLMIGSGIAMYKTGSV